MELQTYCIVHEHQHGVSTHLVKCDFNLFKFFYGIYDAEDPEAAKDFLMKYFDIDFEPAYEENITIDCVDDQYKVLTMDMLKSE
jgi:hypothetical protein